LNFEFFILVDGGNGECVADAHVRARMLRIEDALHGPEDDVGKGERNGALGQNERALLIQATVFGEELRKSRLIARVRFRTAENEFAAHISAREQRQVRAAGERFRLRDARTAELLDDQGEFGRVVPEVYR